MKFYSIAEFNLNSAAVIDESIIEEVIIDYIKLQDKENSAAQMTKVEPRLIIYPFFENYLRYCFEASQQPNFVTLKNWLSFNYNSGSMSDKLYAELAHTQLANYSAWASVYNTSEYEDFFTEKNKIAV